MHGRKRDRKRPPPKNHGAISGEFIKSVTTNFSAGKIKLKYRLIEWNYSPRVQIIAIFFMVFLGFALMVAFSRLKIHGALITILIVSGWGLLWLATNHFHRFKVTGLITFTDDVIIITNQSNQELYTIPYSAIKGIRQYMGNPMQFRHSRAKYDHDLIEFLLVDGGPIVIYAERALYFTDEDHLHFRRMPPDIDDLLDNLSSPIGTTDEIEIQSPLTPIR